MNKKIGYLRECRVEGCHELPLHNHYCVHHFDNPPPEHQCSQPNCGKRIFSKGFCVTHYGHYKRGTLGKIDAKRAAKEEKQRLDSERIERELQRLEAELEIKNARSAYDCACGFATRMRWRNRIKYLEKIMSGGGEECKKST